MLRPNKIINIKEKERNFLLNQVKNFKLSASALNTYINSPIKFFENYIICIPQPQNHFAALGTAIHYALNQLNLAFITNKITKSSDMSLDEILGFFNYKLTKDFADHERFEDTLKEGKKILTGYYVEYIQTNLYREPCESEFTFKNAYLEIPGDRPIELTGRVDKIEKINDFGDVRIVDYKTSSPMSKNAIKGNTKTSTGDYWRQLVFYKLLTEKASMFAPTKKSTPLSNIGLSTPKYTAKEFEIDFLKPNTSNKFQKATFEVTQDDLTELTNLIINVVGKIRRLEFPETFVFDPLE